jgi:hypothetical protein
MQLIVPIELEKAKKTKGERQIASYGKRHRPRNLRPVRRLITRAGKTFLQTVWVGRNIVDKKQSHTGVPAQTDVSPEETGRGKPFSSVVITRSKRIMDFAPNDSSMLKKLTAYQDETFKRGSERPSTYEVLQVAEQELTEALSYENSGKDWYQDEVTKLRAMLSTSYPEFGTDTKWNLFLAITSAASPNQEVKNNLSVALRIYDHYKKTGEIPRDQYEESGRVVEEGKNKGKPLQWGVANQGIYKLKTLVNRFKEQYGDDGEEKFIEFMNGATIRSELEKEYSDLPKGQGVHVSGEHDEAVLNSMVFGEKIGMFYGALAGIPGAVASDRWAIRSFRRWTGELTDEEIKKESGDVDRRLDRFESTEDRREFEYICQILGERHGISAAAVQAVFWYYEKRLYQKIGIAPTPEVSYSDVAEEVMNELHKAEGFRPLGPEELKQELLALAQSGMMPSMREFMDWLKGLSGPTSQGA